MNNNNKATHQYFGSGVTKYKHSPSLFQRVYSKDKLQLPDGWASYNIDNASNQGRSILFSQLGIRNDKPAMMRQVILFEDLSMQYFVGKHRVSLEHSTQPLLPCILKMEADIEPAITEYSRVKICQGRNTVPKRMQKSFTFDEELGAFYHERCNFVLSKQEEASRVDSCGSCRNRQRTDEDVVFVG